MPNKKPEWTIGPWKIDDSDATCRQLLAGDGSSLMGDQNYYPWAPSNDADWKLIAKAPELAQILLDIRAAGDLSNAEELFSRAERILKEAGAL